MLYSVLKYLIPRGEHLLMARGVELPSEQDYGWRCPIFLMEQMEWESH